MGNNQKYIVGIDGCIFGWFANEFQEKRKERN